MYYSYLDYGHDCEDNDAIKRINCKGGSRIHSLHTNKMYELLALERCAMIDLHITALVT